HAFLFLVHGHLDQGVGGQVLEARDAGSDEEAGHGDGGGEALLAIDQEQGVQGLQEVLVAAEGGHGVGHGGAIVQHNVLGVHHAAGRVLAEFEELADFGFGSGVHFLEDLFAGFLLQFGEEIGGLVGRHFLHDIGGLLGVQGFQDAGLHFGVLDFGKGVGGGFAVDGFEDGLALGGAEFLDDVGQVGGVHLLQLGVGNVEAQAAQRVGFDDVGELPGDGVGRNAALQAADPGGRQDTLEDAAQDAANPDIDVHDVERIAHAVEQDAHGDVVDAEHLPAGDVDDLLVEKVAGDAQQVLIVMVGDEDFLAELDAFSERNGVHLIEPYGEPGVGAAHQEAVDAGGVDEGDHGGVLDAADPAAFEVHHRHGQQFREIEEILRHRQRPNARPMRAPRLGRKFDSGTDALYTAFGR